MNPQKFAAIAHRDHDYCNPLSAAKFERILDLLPLDEHARVLDLGCGRAELALRIIERFGSTVVAVDNSPFMLDAARERAQWTGAHNRLHLDDTDIRDFKADPETFHLAVMVDAGGIAGGMPAICQKLRGWTRSGGYVMAGVNYWKRKPAGDLSPMIGRREAEVFDHRGNVQAGADVGLIPMHAATASDDEWDDYEWKYFRAVERHAREQPDDPDVAEMLDHVRKMRDAYLRHGRDTIGFAVYLFYRPGPRMG